MNRTFVNGREPFQGYWNREVVLYRGDEVIDQGTIKEVAERRGVQKMTIYFYTTPTGGHRADSRRDKTTGLRAVLVSP